MSERKSARESSLRADAERNRDRITEAARKLYAAEGLGASMASVARAAGVGKATLSRRFPTPDDLIAAVFEDRMRSYVRATELALADPDPWAGFVHYIEEICSMQATDRGFADVLTMSFSGAEAIARLRAYAQSGVVELLSRARMTGHLRDDIVSEDLFVLLLANAAVISSTAGITDAGWRRLVGHLLRSFAAPGAPLPPLPAAPTSADLEEALSRPAAARQY